MKKKLAILLSLIAFIPCVNVKAISLCSNEKKVELSKIASNVKLTYEEAENVLIEKSENPEVQQPLVEYYFTINVLNLTDEIYVKLTNSVTNETKYITYNDSDEGTFKIDWKDLSEVTTFNYVVYSSDKTECPDEQLKTGMITTPKFNEFYSLPECEKVKDYYLCQKYITSNVTSEQFYKSINDYMKKNKINQYEDEEEQREETKKNKKWILPTTISIGVIGTGLTYVIVRKKRSGVL